MRLPRYIQIRWFSSKKKMKVLDSVDNLLVNNEIKHRNHPGIIRPANVPCPQWLLPTVQMILADDMMPVKTICQNGEKLVKHLLGRVIPPEGEELMSKVQKVQTILKHGKPADKVEDDEKLMETKEARKLLRQHIRNHKSVEYTKMNSLSYLAVKSVQDYCVLYKILREINVLDRHFKPETLFDFGSGTGTVIWAASEFWMKSINEYVCVDISKEMNDLSERLIKNARLAIDPRKIFYREYLTGSANPTYDIVVSAYSLLQLPNLKSRIDVIANLWRKTEHYLVIVEDGTNAGYRVVNEARDFVLNYKDKSSGHQRNSHVFSPCPHDFTCPRYTVDNTPCNFIVSYESLPLSGSATRINGRYSYVVLKKGRRPEDDAQWPRIVRPVLKRKKHVICRMCTSSGHLNEQIFTKSKDGRNTYRCARCSEWGDRLPYEWEKVEEDVKKE